MGMHRYSASRYEGEQTQPLLLVCRFFVGRIFIILILFKFVESILCSTTMDGGQLRKQALQKLPRAWCRWWYGAVEGGDDDDGAGAVAEYCVEGDGHISAFLLNNLPLDAAAVHKEINAVLAGAGMTFSQTMVFAALPESLAKAVRRAPGYSYLSTKKNKNMQAASSILLTIARFC